MAVTPGDVTARIVLHRRPHYAGKLLAWTVMLDGVEAGRIKNDSILELPVAAGAHRIELRSPFAMGLPSGRSKPFDVTAGAGDVVRLACLPNKLSGRPMIEADADVTTVAVPGRSPEAQRPTGGPEPRAEGRGSGADGRVTAANIIEIGRREVALGDETRLIDNSLSTSATTRVMRLTKEWTKTYTVDETRATTVSGSAAFTVLAALKAEAERTITRHYSASTDERQSFEEEVTLTIGAGVRSEIVFSWKEIRQNGAVVLESGADTVQIPFEVVVGVTFDQRQIDQRAVDVPTAT
jgi:hypothetical protein